MDTPVFWPGEFQWVEEPGSLQTMGSQRVRHYWVIDTFCSFRLVHDNLLGYREGRKKGEKGGF